MPLRKNIGSGKYIIESVISDEIDDNLDEYITLKLRNRLTYKMFDDSIEKPLQIGDELTNFDGTGKVVITKVNPSQSTIVVRVVNGEYLNFLGTDSYDTNNDTDIHDLSKLRFYSSVNFNDDKYVKVPLEEDQYVFIAIAPVNSRMNIQGSWGKGLIINAFELRNGDNEFNTYYNDNVKNIGDTLFEMTSMITSPITSLSQDQFNHLTTVSPNINADILSVMQINRHLNNSDTVRNIREAYNQKKTAETQLSEVQTKINDISAKLSSISFDDTHGIRQTYTSQLTSLNDQKNNLLTVINNAINTISTNVNSSEIPIENAKYRIRGFYRPNFSEFNGLDLNSHVIGLNVQYRYKSKSSTFGNAVSMSDGENNTYIYSDWNVLNTFNRSKIAACNNGVYSYTYESNNENVNEPSFNQIDIPISQGETVDIRVKVIYDFGQPYITMTSGWSNIINIEFPNEFNKDVSVLTIIEENNNDIETNRFNNILETTGINTHINDMLIDQNVTYYHKPDNISSGFYTAERRIIPLKDKLVSLSNDIASLKSDIEGANNTCKVSISIGDEDTLLYSDRENIITLASYNSFAGLTADVVSVVGNTTNLNTNIIKNVNNNITTNKLVNGVYTMANNKISTMLNISIINTGDTAMKLYSLFPGNRSVVINNSSSRFVNKNDYSSKDNNGVNGGVWFKYAGITKPIVTCTTCDSPIPEKTTIDEVEKDKFKLNKLELVSLQTQNQFITFRINDPWTGNNYYESGEKLNVNNLQSLDRIESIADNSANTSMVIYPYISSKYGLCIDSDDIRSYTVINPGEEIIIPMYCEYCINDNNYIEKTVSFDLRTSLYQDPINYTFTVVAKSENTLEDKLTSSNKKNILDRLKSTIRYNTTVKAVK